MDLEYSGVGQDHWDLLSDDGGGEIDEENNDDGGSELFYPISQKIDSDYFE